jgi:RHS repeat-associated protein
MRSDVEVLPMRVLRLLIAGLLALPSSALARWYDPTVGTWLSRDPVGAENHVETPNSIGPWSYANLNPARYTDPDGREFDSSDATFQRRVDGIAATRESCRQGDQGACSVVKAQTFVAGAGAGIMMAPVVGGVCTAAPQVCAALGYTALAGTLTSGRPTVVALDKQVNDCAEFKTEEQALSCGFAVGSAGTGVVSLVRGAGPALMSRVRDPLQFSRIADTAVREAFQEVAGEDVATLFGQREITPAEALRNATLLNRLRASRVGTASSRFGEHLEAVQARLQVEQRYQQLAALRERAGLPPFDPAVGATGTAASALVEGSGIQRFGLSPKFSPGQQELKQLVFEAMRREGYFPGANVNRGSGGAASLIHAEGNSIIRSWIAHVRQTGQYPKRMSVVSDRQTCDLCERGLPWLIEFLNLERVEVYSGGSTVPLVISPTP